jgi:hypothetical protein
MRPQARQEGTGGSHPSEAVLARFMRGELPPREAAPLVRHLLRGCGRCSAVTRKLWRLGDEVPNPQARVGPCPPSWPVEVWL